MADLLESLSALIRYSRIRLFLARSLIGHPDHLGSHFLNLVAFHCCFNVLFIAANDSIRQSDLICIAGSNHLTAIDRSWKYHLTVQDDALETTRAWTRSRH
jgi:hypothetical protein